MDINNPKNWKKTGDILNFYPHYLMLSSLNDYDMIYYSNKKITIMHLLINTSTNPFKTLKILAILWIETPLPKQTKWYKTTKSSNLRGVWGRYIILINIPFVPIISTNISNTWRVILNFCREYSRLNQSTIVVKYILSLEILLVTCKTMCTIYSYVQQQQYMHECASFFVTINSTITTIVSANGLTRICI